MNTPSPTDERFAVFGAGVMGTQIAQVLATSGFDVAVFDPDEHQSSTVVDRMRQHRFGLERAVELGKLSPAAMQAALGRVRVASTLDDAAADASIVIEAVPEDLALKSELFRTLDRVVGEHTLLCSNTGGLSATAMAWATEHPSRMFVWHWSQPCVIMRMAEIVVHDAVSDDAVERVRQAAVACGKRPVVVQDNPNEWGFVANRINRAVRREAARIVEEGVASREQVDVLVKDCFNWPMGPFENADQASFE